MIGQTWVGGVATATANGQVIVRATAQAECTVIRLVLTVVDAVGAAVDLGTVMIADIKVGTMSQFTALQPMPASILASDGQANNAGYATGCVRPGTDFAVIIANGIAGHTYNFGAVCLLTCSGGRYCHRRGPRGLARRLRW